MTDDDKKRGIGFSDLTDDDLLEDDQESFSWFFGIGINDYLDFPPLSNAVKDVKDVYALLTSRYHIDNALFLFNEEATRSQIMSGFDDLKSKVGPADKLIIYYSGHGHLDSDGLGYWVPHNADHHTTAEYIRNSALRDYIRYIKARHLLLISDSCFSGSLLVDGASRSTTAMDQLGKRISRWVISSGGHDEEVSDGKAGENSPFARSILDALGENEEERYNAAKLLDRVIELTTGQYRQLPMGGRIFEAGDRGGQYIFQLKENNRKPDWENCLMTDQLADYRDFVQKYPDSAEASQAREWIAVKEEDEYWNIARERNRISTYRDYNNKYPKGRFLVESWERIEAIEHDQVWNDAIKKGTIQAYRDYLEAYPDGPYVEKANEEINEIIEKKYRTHYPSTKSESAAAQASADQHSPDAPSEVVNPHTKSKDAPTAKIPSDFKTVTINGQLWMSENLNLDIPGAATHDLPFLRYNFGRVYTWEAALKACPPGWRLPTLDDWNKLINSLGGSKNAYLELMEGGKTGFDAKMAGWCDEEGQFFHIHEYAYFWTGSEKNEELAFHYYFDYSYRDMFKAILPKTTYRSVRYISEG